MNPTEIEKKCTENQDAYIEKVKEIINSEVRSGIKAALIKVEYDKFHEAHQKIFYPKEDIIMQWHKQSYTFDDKEEIEVKDIENKDDIKP